MKRGYTDERNIQILIFLLKHHNIRKVIASPGTTNMTFVGSIQYDPFFEIYSSVDERSASYMACGLAAESGEPVALSCTGATASRNYVPGLTEAFYRKLPVLAITSTQNIGRIGLNIPQVIDRSTIMNDIAKYSINVPMIQCLDDEWSYSIKMNEALLELRRNGCGPVHINIATTYSHVYDCYSLPDAIKINRYSVYDKIWPDLNNKKSIGVFVGAHKRWDSDLTELVEIFCEKYNSVVYCDANSNYPGKYGVYSCVLASQDRYISENIKLDVLIDIGDVSGNYANYSGKEVWRVNEDGVVRAPFRSVRYIFECPEKVFFEKYVAEAHGEKKNIKLYENVKAETDALIASIPELPFSNVWIAKETMHRIPDGSILYLGILNSLRTWSYFDKPSTVTCYSNTGGFGIDGGMSSLIGASLSDENKLAFGVFGDLQFFYDMNSLGNRHIHNNVRILIINNGMGAEFKNYFHDGAAFGDDADLFISAGGHFGNKSKVLVKNYAENLGFMYLSAENKSEYLECLECFVSVEKNNKPLLFEVFTTPSDESMANEIIRNLETSFGDASKQIIKGMIGEKRIKTIKRAIGKQ